MSDEKGSRKAERHKALASILEEIDGMEPELFSPNNPAAKADKVLGTVKNDFIKKTFAAATLHRREQDQLLLEHKYGSHEADLSLQERIQEESQRSGLLFEVFWFCVRSELRVWDVGVGIRQGWSVVAVEDDSLFRGLLDRLRGPGS